MKKLYCCNKEASYIDMGTKLQYYFCKECRKEVAEPIVLEEVVHDNKIVVESDDIWSQLSTLVWFENKS